MATLKDNISMEDFNIFVAFHITDGTALGAAISKLNNLMDDVFGDTQSRELVSMDYGNQEIIYKIQKPVLVSPGDMELFFDRLRKVFNASSSMSPHFTQISSDQ